MSACALIFTELDGRRHVSRVRETAEAWSGKFLSDGEEIIRAAASEKRVLEHSSALTTETERCFRQQAKTASRGRAKIRPTGRILCVTKQ